MKNIVCLLICIFGSHCIFGQIDRVTIKGSVSDGIGALSDVNIRSIDDGTGTKTDTNGIYNIVASKGSTLKYSHIGFEDIEIQLEDYDRTLNIVMVPKIEKLDNVDVTQKIKTRKTQKEMFLEYNTNPDLIKTKFGIQDKEISGTAMYIIEDKDINPIAVNVLAVIQGKVPGASISPRGNPDARTHPDDLNAVIYLRGGRSSWQNSKPAIYEVDGNIYEDPPLFLNINNIKRIAVLPSLFSATMYGTIAVGGVIVINTKSGNFSPNNIDSPNYDRALVRNNTFENNAIEYSLLANGSPTYLVELMNAETLEDAKEIYGRHVKNYRSSIYFILDTYEHFHTIEDEPKFADRIISTHAAQFESDPRALKALAYMYQVQGRHEKANEVYRRLFTLRPNYSQSYIDLANSYKEIGEITKGAAMYARYGYLVEEGFLPRDEDFEGIMNKDYLNLVKTEGKTLIAKRNQKEIRLNTNVYNKRLLFEWNDSEAEFEFQFVNPEGKYFRVQHSASENAERIKNQKVAGYSMEEQLIDDSFKGEWQVNVNYLGNKSLTPTYLKVTVYHNFNLPSQSKETKLFRLGLKNVNQKLFEFLDNGNISMR